MKVVQLADDVRVVLGGGTTTNAVLVDTGETGVVWIDTLFTPSLAGEVLEEAGRMSGAGIAAVINTHFHGDHVFGNGVAPTARIIAHHSTRARLRALGDGYVDTVMARRPDLTEELTGLRLRLPTETVATDLTLHFPALTLHLRHFGRTAHTDGDLVVLIPERDLVIAGDLVFNGITPVIRDGDLGGLRATLLDLKRQEGFSTVIPGHGPVAGREVLDQQLELIDGVETTARSVAGSGGDAAAAERVLVERFGHLALADQRMADWVGKALPAPA